MDIIRIGVFLDYPAVMGEPLRHRHNDCRTLKEVPCGTYLEGDIVAQTVITRLTDDLDGHEAAETVVFSLDGTAYEIDLSESNAGSFRDTLAVYIANGRKLTSSGKPLRRVSSGYDARAVRAWAQSRGMTVPARGRIPKSVVQAFHDAGN